MLKLLADIIILKYVYDSKIQYNVIVLSSWLSDQLQFTIALTSSEFSSGSYVGPKFDFRKPVNSQYSEENKYKVK